MQFSAPVHQDALLIMNIVDEVWAAETLPIEDITVPASDMNNVEEDDTGIAQEDDDVNKWNDFALEQFSKFTDIAAPIIDTTTVASDTTGKKEGE